MNKINIEKIKVYGFHGVMPEENIIGSYYEVNLSLNTNFIKACVLDDINYTINYSEINDIVLKEMKITSKLLENVAFRIIKKIFESFSISLIYIKISKINPPVCGEVHCCSVEIETTFDDFKEKYIK